MYRERETVDSMIAGLGAGTLRRLQMGYARNYGPLLAIDDLTVRHLKFRGTTMGHSCELQSKHTP